MKPPRRRLLPEICGMLAMLVMACAPTSPAASTASVASPPVAKKVLTLGTQLEPPAFVQALRPGGQGGGNAEVEPFVHDNLFTSVQYEVYAPQLVEELPSLQN